MCVARKFDQILRLASGVENEVLEKPVKYFEMSLLQSRENKKIRYRCLSIALNMSNTILLTEFR